MLVSSNLANFGGLKYNTFANTMDSMGRPATLTKTDQNGQNSTWAQNAAYGPGGELKTLQYKTTGGVWYTENRSFNNRLQLTQLQSSGTGLAGVNLQYSYPTSGANNGQLAGITDVLSGEQIAYTYDSLSRLLKGETTQNQSQYPNAPWWGQSFGYDGFGNLMSKTPTAGHTATTMSLSIDPVTNHLLTSGFAYDANGNMTSFPTSSGTQGLSYDEVKASYHCSSFCYRRFGKPLALTCRSIICHFVVSVVCLAQGSAPADRIGSVSAWTTFANKAGWSIKHPGNLKIASCRQCPDPTATDVFVVFRDPFTSDSMMIEPLADEPRDQGLNKWLHRISNTIANPVIKEEWIYLDGWTALKVTNQGPDSSENENIYFVRGSKTFAIRVSNTHNSAFYALYRQMLSTFRF